MSSHQSKVYELAKWIDTTVIAEAILELDGVETVEQAKEVWLRYSGV